jgi:hypothetical protein
MADVDPLTDEEITEVEAEALLGFVRRPWPTKVTRLRMLATIRQRTQERDEAREVVAKCPYCRNLARWTQEEKP